MPVDMELGVAAVLRVLGEPIRWRIVELLAEEELCVCHLVEELDVPQPLVSHHLAALRRAGIVESERFRQWVYYRLRRDVLDDLVERLRSLPAARTSTRRPCC